MKLQLDRENRATNSPSCPAFLLPRSRIFARVLVIPTGKLRISIGHQIEAIGQNRRAAFREFCQAIDLDVQSPADRERAFDYLRRTHFHHFLDDQSMRDELRAWTGMLFIGVPDAVIAAMADSAQHELRKPIRADDLRRHLDGLGFHPKQLAHDTRIAPAIEERRREFVEWLQPKLIRGQLIPREDTRQIREMMKTDGVVVVHGTAGPERVGCSSSLQEELSGDRVVCLPITLDQRHPKNTTREFGEDLGLPDSPVLCLDALAGDRPAILIVDQLDALRWTAGTPTMLSPCAEPSFEKSGLSSFADGKQASSSHVEPLTWSMTPN